MKQTKIAEVPMKAVTMMLRRHTETVTPLLHSAKLSAVGLTYLGFTAMTKSRVGPRPRPAEGHRCYWTRTCERERFPSSIIRLPVRKAKPARMASLFRSVSELCGVMASQNINAKEPSADSSPP